MSQLGVYLKDFPLLITSNVGVCELLAAVTTQDYIVFLTKPALL